MSLEETAVDYPGDFPAELFQPAPLPQNTITHEAFRLAVRSRILEVIGPTNPPADYLEHLCNALPEELDTLIHKFAEGQLKHGGDIRDRDLLHEASCEARDLTHYLLAMRIQRSLPPTIPSC